MATPLGRRAQSSAIFFRQGFEARRKKGATEWKEKTYRVPPIQPHHAATVVELTGYLPYSSNTLDVMGNVVAFLSFCFSSRALGSPCAFRGGRDYPRPPARPPSCAATTIQKCSPRRRGESHRGIPSSGRECPLRTTARQRVLTGGPRSRVRGSPG